MGVWRNKRWLIRDIDFEIHRGEIVSLIGPNGSGKTTVTEVLAGSIRPDAGRVERANNLRIGYVPQHIQIDPTLPITLKRMMSIPYRVDQRSIDEALQELNIAHLKNAPVQKLSGGEFQRALIARALLRKPDMLILDEPNRGLDIDGEAKLYEQIVLIRDRLNCGILFVCHDLHVVMAKTDTVVCINVHICCKGAPEHVKTNSAYLEMFGLGAGHAHAMYVHSHNHRHRLDGSVETTPNSPRRAAQRR